MTYKNIANLPKNIKNIIEDSEDFFDLKQNLIYSSGKKSSRKSPKKSHKLNILISCLPCGGFGDIMFAYKLSKILRQYYNANVKIATTMTDGLNKLGEPQKNIYKLATSKNSTNNKKTTQCRRYNNIKVFDFSGKKRITKETLEKFDLFFDAPIMADYEPDLYAFKKTYPKANLLNSYFFSEYNDKLDKEFDFNMGIGCEKIGNEKICRDGMLILPNKMLEISNKKHIENKLKLKGNIPTISDKYAMVYIADISGAEKCIFSFIQMISKKYTQDGFQIIIPNFTLKYLNIQRLRKYIKNYGKVISVDKGGRISGRYNITIGNEKTLYLRGDIYPLVNKDMLGLMKYSVRDILLTGDQSITDALSCCGEKNIFYQIAGWKEDFGENLAKLLPNKYLFEKRTECGTMKAIKYNSNYKKFIKKWGFLSLGKKHLDKVMKFGEKLRESGDLRTLQKMIESSRDIISLENKIYG